MEERLVTGLYMYLTYCAYYIHSVGEIAHVIADDNFCDKDKVVPLPEVLFLSFLGFLQCLRWCLEYHYYDVYMCIGNSMMDTIRYYKKVSLLEGCPHFMG